MIRDKIEILDIIVNIYTRTGSVYTMSIDNYLNGTGDIEYNAQKTLENKGISEKP